jgi:hypothetical protein
MQRTAEEFVHQLPSGRWFVGDFVRSDADGSPVFLVELTPGGNVVEVSLPFVSAPGSAVRTYANKASAKRAAQRMIERVLEEDVG